jgi:hypothetical protein
LSNNQGKTQENKQKGKAEMPVRQRKRLTTESKGVKTVN